MDSDLQRVALAYLEAHRVMTLATSGIRGVWAAAVFYVNEAFDLFFLSAAHTRHAQDIQTHPIVAATIHEDYADWPEIRGIQLEGNVTRVRGDARLEARSLYQAKFPFVAGSDSQILAAMDKVNWYRLRPERFYFIDNSKGLGHRDEVSLVW